MSADRNSEIQHPTDLIGIPPYLQLVWLLILLEVVPNNVHLLESRFWDEYNDSIGFEPGV